MTRFVLFVVDRLEGNKAVLIEDDTEREIVVFTADLATSEPIREGQVLGLPRDEGGQVQPGQAIFLAGMTRRRRQNLRQRQREAPQDPGGDLDL